MRSLPAVTATSMLRMCHGAAPRANMTLAPRQAPPLANLKNAGGRWRW